MGRKLLFKGTERGGEGAGSNYRLRERKKQGEELRKILFTEMERGGGGRRKKFYLLECKEKGKEQIKNYCLRERKEEGWRKGRKRREITVYENGRKSVRKAVVQIDIVLFFSLFRTSLRFDLCLPLKKVFTLKNRFTFINTVKIIFLKNSLRCIYFLLLLKAFLRLGTILGTSVLLYVCNIIYSPSPYEHQRSAQFCVFHSYGHVRADV